MSFSSWEDLEYWRSGEWQVIEEHIDDLEKVGKLLCPSRANLFNSLDTVDYCDVRVAILGQDPYPDPYLATGIAFSVPRKVELYPPALMNIIKEYVTDLHYGEPPHEPPSGNLEKWCHQGVFLWNVIPSCEKGKPLSHYHWKEWYLLTEEIIKVLNTQEIIFVFLGSVAQEFVKHVDQSLCEVITTSYPSPKGILRSKNPFIGSRLFSTINDKLCFQKKAPIDWRL